MLDSNKVNERIIERHILNTKTYINEVEHGKNNNSGINNEK